MPRTLLIGLAAAVFAAASWLTVRPALEKHQAAAVRRQQPAVPANDIAAVPGDATPTPQSEADAGGRDRAAVVVQPAKAPPSGPIGTIRQALSNAKNGAYGWLRAHDLATVVSIMERIKRYLWDPKAWLWLVFFLLLERLIPAKPIRSLFSANKLQDFMYPIFSATVRGLVLLVAYEPVRNFYANHLSFLNTRLLDGLPLFWQGLGAFLALDLAHWFSHFVRHKVRWLWHFHSVHHSQVELNPLTAWRSHPLESFLIFTLVLVPTGIFGGDRSTWIVVDFLYGVVWPPFTHSNIRTNLGWFRYILVSPQYHRVHHSVDPKQYDCNFGEHLIIWDWLFGTMWKDHNSYPDTGIPYGKFIEERSRNPAALALMWVKHLVYPFMMIGKSIRDAALRLAGRPAVGG